MASAYRERNAVLEPVSLAPPPLALSFEDADAAVEPALAASEVAAQSPPAVDVAALEATPLPVGIAIAEGELGPGETLAQSLADRGVSPEVVHRISTVMRPHFDFRNAQPGHRYRLTLGPEGRIQSFRYFVTSIVQYEMRRGPDDQLSVERVEAELQPHPAMIAGIVTSSLYGAITDLGGGAQLAADFTEVFAYDLDFSRMVRPGDEFRILYERLYRTNADGEEVFVRPGRILAARYGGSAGEHTAVYFEPEAGDGGYYRPDGSSVERQFLMAPLHYSRISSRYTSARRHPILNITRPHHGIDYAAPEGTPVYAVADGKVIYRAWAGGFGNLVKIRHANGYVSYYAHLSRYGRDLRVGQHVGQKQVIGYVGSTGLATGPHVCFRIAKDGHYVNPSAMPSPAGPPLPDDLRDSFQAHSDVLMAALDSGTLVAGDEAL